MPTQPIAFRPQENFPLPRLDVLSHPSQDDYERAKDKARQLLRSILPDNAWRSWRKRALSSWKENAQAT